MPSTSPKTGRRKTSLSLSAAAAKSLAKAKYELFDVYDIQVSQSEILDVVLLEDQRGLEDLKNAIIRRRESPA